jgi:hypothetical protein
LAIARSARPSDHLLIPVIGAIDLNTIRGLSEREAAERLKAEGYNELPSAKRRSLFAIALEVAREPMLSCPLFWAFSLLPFIEDREKWMRAHYLSPR